MTRKHKRRLKSIPRSRLHPELLRIGVPKHVAPLLDELHLPVQLQPQRRMLGLLSERELFNPFGQREKRSFEK